MANTVQKPIKLCEEDSGVIEDEAVVETELINNSSTTTTITHRVTRQSGHPKYAFWGDFKISK